MSDEEKIQGVQASNHQKKEQIMKDTPDLYLKYEVSLPTLNEYIDVERTSKYMAGTMKRATTNRIKFWTMSQSRIKLQGVHDLVLVWTRNNRHHDPDNVYASIKFLLDGIVAAGVLPDDSRKYVRNIAHRIQDGKSCMVEVYFYKV